MPDSVLTGLIAAWYQKTGSVGVGACVFDPRGMVWSLGLGLANQESGVGFQPDSTIMNIASVSKVVTAATAMRLVEDGIVSLDDSIEKFLDHPVRHPAHPKTPVRVVHLLTHVSALDDGPAYKASYAPGDPNPDLARWLRRYLDPAGDLYDPCANWHPWRPGEQWAYSNVGFGLLALVVERAAGIDFRGLTRDAIFRPLSMASTGWLLADIDRSRLVIAALWAPESSSEAASPGARQGILNRGRCLTAQRV